MNLRSPRLHVFIKGTESVISLDVCQVNGLHVVDEVLVLVPHGENLRPRFRLFLIIGGSLQRIDGAPDLITRHAVERYLKSISFELAQLQAIGEFDIGKLVPKGRLNVFEILSEGVRHVAEDFTI